MHNPTFTLPTPPDEWTALRNWMERNEKTPQQLTYLITKMTSRRVHPDAVEQWIAKVRQPRTFVFIAIYMITHFEVDANSYYGITTSKDDPPK